MSQDLITQLVAICFILAVLMPIWALWIGMRIVKHLYHISTALWQIRDALREQPAEKPAAHTPHIANSMFGR